MRTNAKILALLPAILVAGVCLFSLSASHPPVEKPECGLPECCRKKNAEPTCTIKASGTEFGVFDAGSRLFTAKS